MSDAPLRAKFSLWIFFAKNSHPMKASEYENNLRKVADIDSVRRFWGVYQHLQRPSRLPPNCELFFFKDDIKPVWENKHNRGGGKFIIRPREAVLDEVWERLLLETLFCGHPLLCGIDLSSKRSEISIWTKEIELYSQKEDFKNWIFAALGFGERVFLEYKEHPLTEDIAPLEKDWDYLLQTAKGNVQ